jgi:RNA polymerase sigma factor (TIGR02999 family)
MPEQPVSRTTELVKSIARGDRLAADQLMAELYGEFRTLARRYLDREPRGHTLQPTALGNEVYLRLVDQTQVDWKGRTHFFALGAQAMRRVLVDHARRKGRLKRGVDVNDCRAAEADHGGLAGTAGFQSFV